MSINANGTISRTLRPLVMEDTPALTGNRRWTARVTAPTYPGRGGDVRRVSQATHAFNGLVPHRRSPASTTLKPVQSDSQRWAQSQAAARTASCRSRRSSRSPERVPDRDSCLASRLPSSHKTFDKVLALQVPTNRKRNSIKARRSRWAWLKVVSRSLLMVVRLCPRVVCSMK